MPQLKFDTVRQAARQLFCVWSNEGDFHWFENNYNRFNWYYENEVQLEALKIKLCGIANLYYEFCHEAYGMYMPISDEIIEDFETSKLPFSAFRLGQLSGQEYLTELKDETDDFNDHQDYLLRSAVTELAANVRYKIFEELYTTKNYTPDSLFESFEEIADASPDYKGLEYLMQWGDTFSNYS